MRKTTMMSKKDYPDNWPAVALATKEAAGWRYLGIMMSREQVESRLEALLALERVI
jgi:hypothetical protein